MGLGPGVGLGQGVGVGLEFAVGMRVIVSIRRDRLGKGRAEDAARFVVEHRLPADHVRYARQLAQLSGQTCGAAACEHDQLQLAGEYMRPHCVDERINGDGLKPTTCSDEAKGGLRLKWRIAVARKDPDFAAGEQLAEI